MSTHASQANSSPQRIRSIADVVRFHAIVTIGATGAPTVSYRSDPGIGVTRASAGNYGLTYPKGRRAWITSVTLQSAANTVVTWVRTAIDATAGTAAIRTLGGTNASAATDPANGDVLDFTLEVEV